MKRCAFLTLNDPTGFVIDDQLAYAPLRELGWQVEAIPWTKEGVSWAAYDAVVIRSTWDYTADPPRFLAALAEIEKSGVPLLNDLQIVRWNLNKTYLKELSELGVPIVPTVWRDRLGSGDLRDLCEQVGAEEAIVKPVIGAGARGAFRLNRRRLTEQQSAIADYYADRPLMAQPFVASVVAEGEYSLFYFGGEISHAIVKTPQAEDFRVQEEHGGRIQPVHADHELRTAADLAVQAVGKPLLYARADLVRNDRGDGFWLMELELIEPSLYLRMDAAAPRRFALALDRQVRGVAQ